MYSHGRDKISDLLNTPLHEFLSLTLAMILTIFLIKISLLLDELSQKMTAYFITSLKAWL
jgi:hypothetical protein